MDTLVICKLTSLQAKLYEHICTLTKQGLGKTSEEGRQSALASITHLKKLCNDPELVYENYKDLFYEHGGEFRPGVFQPEFSGGILSIFSL